MHLIRANHLPNLAGVILLALLPACRRQADSPSAEPKGFLAIVGVGQDDPLWPVLSATAVRTYGDLGLSYPPIRTVAPETTSVNQQKNLLLRMHDEGMVAACIQVTDAAGLTGTIDALAAQGVRIVTMIERIETDVRHTHVGFNDQAIGTALADAVAEAVDQKGTIAVLHADSVNRASVKRHAAFRDRIARFPDVRVILDFDCHADPRQAETIIRQVMRRYPRLNGWALMDNWPLRAGNDRSPLLPAGCHIVSVDPFPSTWSRFEKDQVFAMIASDYELLAERALTAGVSEVIGTVLMPVSFEAPVRTVRATGLDKFKLDWLRWASEITDDTR